MSKAIAVFLSLLLVMPCCHASAFAEEHEPESSAFEQAVDEPAVESRDSVEQKDALSEADSSMSESRRGLDGSQADDLAVSGGKPIVLEDGLYTLRCASQPNVVLDIAGASLASGANVQVWDANNSPAQRFYLDFDSEGYCTIENVSSGMLLDVSGALAVAGTNVQQWPSNGNDAQKWRLLQSEEGVRFASKLSESLVLDISGACLWSGGNVQIWQENGTSAQLFTLDKIERTIDDGLYSIESAVSEGKVLDVAGGSLAAGTNAQIWSSNLTAAQKFFVLYDESTGYYTVKNASSLLCLDVCSGVGLEGTNVQFWTENGQWAQAWSIVCDDSGFWVLESACGGFVLDVAGASERDGSNVQLWTSNGSSAQRWRLSAADDAAVVEDGLYRIYFSENAWRSVAVEDGSLAAQANVELGGSANVWSQKFQITTDSDGYSTIVNLASGMALDVAGASSAPGANVWQWVVNQTDAQKWKAVYRPEGLAFISKLNGLALDVEGGSSSIGANIQLWYDNWTSAQAFKLVATDRSSDVEEGAYTLRSMSEGDCIDVEGASSLDGAPLQTWEANGSYAQKFKILSASNGMAMVNVHSGKYVSAQNRYSSQVVQEDRADEAEQRWDFIPADESGKVFYVRSVLDGRCLTASGGSLVLEPYSGSSDQMFVLERTDSFKVYLDAGHGQDSSGWGTGFDSGAVGSGYREADLTAEFVQALASELRRRGIEVVASTEIAGIPYWERHEKAVELGCSTFVSVHFNAGGGTGVESFVHSYNAASGSSSLQDLLHPALAVGMGLTDRGEKSAALAVCGGRLPAVLLEMAFIDNAVDMKVYQERKGQAVLFLAGALETASKHPECAWN